ncbi:MAG: restriction endonuclease subunit S, partial [Lentisphaeria bacterium]|nr:restriction endonuclease subunit S [Lentisphaeria bacterium]
AVEGRLVPTEACLCRARHGRQAELARKEGRSYEPASELLERILAERKIRWIEDTAEKARAKGNAKVLLEAKAGKAGKPWTPEDDAKALETARAKARLKYKEPEAPDTTDLPALPEGWCWTSVDQLSIVVRGASPRPAGDPRFFGGPVPWITVGDLTSEKTPYLRQVPDSLTEEGASASRLIPEDTLLLTNSGATLGVPRITLIAGCINDGSVALLHVTYPLKLYLYYYLTTLTKALRLINQGAAQPNLNTGIVRALNVPLPPTEEQERISHFVEEKLGSIGYQASSVERALRRCSSLRHSILKWAFEGKLVEQDPNDEPAAVLLKRITAQRVAGAKR